MGIISFAIQEIISNTIQSGQIKFIEKMSLKMKFRKIKAFEREFDNTSIDTYAFQSFINNTETQRLIYNFVFSTQFKNISQQDFIQNLVTMALDYINQLYKAQGRSKLENQNILKAYFESLLERLVNFRDQDLNAAQKSTVASIQDSIIETNKNLKHYLEEKFQDIKNYSLAKYLTEDKINEILQRSIQSLGQRYIREANVETKSKKIFKTLTFDIELQNFLEHSNRRLIQHMDVCLEQIKNKGLEQVGDIEVVLNSNKSIIENFNSRDKEYYNTDKYSTYINSLNILNYTVREFNSYINDEGKYRLSSNTPIKKNSKSILKILGEIKEYIEYIEPELVNNPYLVIEGEAGIGKSHLLADIAQEKKDDGHIVFLFLGQHFNTKDHPWQQIFNFLEYKGDTDSFLNEINSRSMRTNKRAIIFIDALNEGEGKYFWDKYIVDFIERVRIYPNIAIVMSNRINHMKSIFPDDFFKLLPITLYKHIGFTNFSIDMLEPFLKYYKINPLIVPYLPVECRNPLYLRMYCEVASPDSIEHFSSWSITEVLSNYVRKMNSKLARDERFQYIEQLNLVNNCLKAIAFRMYEKKEWLLQLKEVQEIIIEVTKDATQGNQIFLYGLLEENLITISADYEGNDRAYFSYERFGDIFTAYAIIDKMQNKEDCFKQFNEGYRDYSNIYEALSIVLPERMGLELYEVINQDSVEIAESMIRGLTWRKASSIKPKVITFMEAIMEKDNSVRNLYYAQLIQTCINENNLLNANYLHNHLKEMTLAKRDSTWTIFINENKEILNRVTDLPLFKNGQIHLSENTSFLLATTITWLFTSSHKVLRDKSTHALVNLLKNNMKLVLPLLTRFKDVNDPYVYERLFAGIYGACLRTNQTTYLTKISEYILDEVFNKTEIYPHVLLRDYARGIILYTKHIGIFDHKNVEQINPPYNSKWYDHIPKLEEIDQYTTLYSPEKYGKKAYSVKAIINSMTTEYGRGTGEYGDFGRYTFQSTLSDWSNQFDIQDLSNIATKNIFDLGYDVETHGEYDLMNGKYYDRHGNILERIGKKYQWIAFHELIARLTDNFPVYQEEKEYAAEYYNILKEKDNEFLKFIISQSGEGNSVSTIIEDLDWSEIEVEHINPDDYIKEIKRIEKPYKGPWELFVRDIDCTVLVSKKEESVGELITFPLPETNKKQWVLSNYELNNAKSIFEIIYESQEYFSLGQLYVNKLENGPHYYNRDEICIKTKAVFVKNDSIKEYTQREIKKGGGNGVNWRQSYETFAFEFCWHPSVKDDEYFDDEQDQYISQAVWDYSWEGNYDYSTDEGSSLSYLMPDPILINYFNLIQSQEGVWINSAGDIVAFDASIFGFESCLLFNKGKLNEFLESNSLTLFWNTYIEKVSDKYYHEWWLLYQLKGNHYSYDILDERQGDLKKF
ncbi:NACHT domain-containing protein [Fictibacillus sp. FJAT-27399]|uniref:NACHT domain-containing protein n=1 Tax=Fictibacillus sp. FJAT-27399 TaxID=1729689 RepID=UPI000782FD1B|nr:hypothetical protein [Fictibacillus sp. FJAT-27399]